MTLILTRQPASINLFLRHVPSVCRLPSTLTTCCCRDYEPGPDQGSSLHQLSWCERNLQLSLQNIKGRKVCSFTNSFSLFIVEELCEITNFKKIIIFLRNNASNQLLYVIYMIWLMVKEFWLDGTGETRKDGCSLCCTTNRSSTV